MFIISRARQFRGDLKKAIKDSKRDAYELKKVIATLNPRPFYLPI